MEVKAPTQTQIEQHALDVTAADLIRRAATLDRLAVELEAYAQTLAQRERMMEMRENDVLKAGEQLKQWRIERRRITQREQKQRKRANAA